MRTKSFIEPYVVYSTIGDLEYKRDMYHITMFFIETHIARHPNKKMLLCNLSSLYVALIVDDKYIDSHDEDMKLLKSSYLKDYGLECFEKYGAVIGGYMLTTDVPQSGTKGKAKYVDIIDTTVRGLNLANLLLDDSYTEYIPREIIPESAIFWLRYYWECYDSVKDVYEYLTNWNSNIDVHALEWYHLKRWFKHWENFQETNYDKYLIDGKYDDEFDMVRARSDFLNEYDSDKTRLNVITQ